MCVCVFFPPSLEVTRDDSGRFAASCSPDHTMHIGVVCPGPRTAGWPWKMVTSLIPHPPVYPSRSSTNLEQNLRSAPLAPIP